MNYIETFKSFFPKDYKIKILPPGPSGAPTFLVKKGKAKVSLVLYSSQYAVPVWGIYGYKDNHETQFCILDTTSLLEAIKARIEA